MPHPRRGAGHVVAFEYETREPSPQALQDSWAFQRELPVRSARYTLVLPTAGRTTRSGSTAPESRQTQSRQRDGLGDAQRRRR